MRLLIIVTVWIGLSTAIPVQHQEVMLSRASAAFLHRAFFSIYPETHVELTCLECLTASAALDLWMMSGATVEEIENFAINECIVYNMFPPDVCSGMVNLAGPEVVYVLNNTEYSFNTICGWLLGVNCYSNELNPWSIEIPGGKPSPSHPEPQQPPAHVMKILHLSDLHVDLLYDEGSATICDHPYCCRHDFGEPGPGETAAGHWGALAYCDIPLNTLENLISQAAEITKPDLVYVTGDLPPHDVWAQDHASNLLAIEVTLSLLKQYFPDVPVVNALGNHAAAPVNSFVVPSAYNSGFDMKWLYDPVAELWAEWLPESALPDVQRGGFFAYSPMPGLRVVSLNMNFCNKQNWWLLLDNKDPTEELQWLVETLSAAEAAGEAVHILGHIPSGKNDCDHTWSHLFNLIVYRFESTIRALFFGHTHGDSFSVHYDYDNETRPVAVSFITPSGTTGTHHHPSFKLFEVDGGHEAATWVVLDATVYNMNITEANMEGGSPVYKERYSTQDSYGLSSMSAASMHQLVLNMVTQEGLYERHQWNVNNDMKEMSPPGSCDASCLKQELCKLVVTDSSDKTQCENLKDYINSVTGG